jgi:hypothetical protein
VIDPHSEHDYPDNGTFPANLLMRT